MATQVTSVPGVTAGRQIVPLQIFTSSATARYAPAWYFFDGAAARDPDNSPTSMLRAGLILGVENASAANPGSIANSIIGLTTAPLGGAQTTLTMTTQAAAEVVRRQGASGTFTLTGEAAPGLAARSLTVAYSAINTSTGVATITPTATAGTGGTNQVNSLVTVDSTGSGTFTLTVEGITTGAITYSSTAATLVSNINTALDATFGSSAIVASGASLAALILTFSGTGYTHRPVGTVKATILAGSTGYTINGSGTVGTPSTSPVTTAGVLPSGADEGEFVAGSLVQPTDGSQTPTTIFDTEYGTDVTSDTGASLNEPLHRYVIGGDLYSANIINLTTCSAGSQAWIKSQLRATGGTFTFDNDR